jgi:hypothetical protein
VARAIHGLQLPASQKSVVTTSPGSAAEAATEEASTAARQETRRTVAVPQLVAWPTAQT